MADVSQMHAQTADVNHVAEPLNPTEEQLYRLAESILAAKIAKAQAAANAASQEFSELVTPIRQAHEVPMGVPAEILPREDGVVFIHYNKPVLALVPSDPEPVVTAEEPQPSV